MPLEPNELTQLRASLASIVNTAYAMNKATDEQLNCLGSGDVHAIKQIDDTLDACWMEVFEE